MGHSIEIINKTLNHIYKSYKKNNYNFIIEQRFRKEKPIIYPDIQVLDKNNKEVCVVEIGYTRPEKLTRYKRLGVKDIRWYDKKGELRNAHEIKAETIIQEKIDHPDNNWEGVWIGCDNFSWNPCMDCLIDGYEDGEYYNSETRGVYFTNSDVFMFIFECDYCGKVWCQKDVEDIEISFNECFGFWSGPFAREWEQFDSYYNFQRFQAKLERAGESLIGLKYNFKELNQKIKDIYGKHFTFYYDEAIKFGKIDWFK